MTMGSSGLGNPIAVEGEVTRQQHLVTVDSGAPWAFATGGNPRNEVRVFGVHSGWGLRSKPFLGTDKWAALSSSEDAFGSPTSPSGRVCLLTVHPSARRAKRVVTVGCTEGLLDDVHAGPLKKWRRFPVGLDSHSQNVHFGEFSTAMAKRGTRSFRRRTGLHYVLYAGAV
jgi:hypothetical protein